MKFYPTPVTVLLTHMKYSKRNPIVACSCLQFWKLRKSLMQRVHVCKKTPQMGKV